MKQSLKKGFTMESSHPNENLILHTIVDLLQQIVLMQGTQNIPEFILHELCKTKCFDLKKAAYLVDNPDFNCLKGVAGFSAENPYTQVVWETPELFTAHMQNSDFNQKVRSILHPSKIKGGTTDQETAQIVGNYLGIESPTLCSWPMKHDNQGILIYQRNATTPLNQELLQKGSQLFSFCPIH